MGRIYDHLFDTGSSESEETEELVVASREMLSWAREPEYKRFLDYLQEEAMKPTPTGDQMSMIQSAVRANTFKEIRKNILDRERKARMVTEETG